MKIHKLHIKHDEPVAACGRKDQLLTKLVLEKDIEKVNCKQCIRSAGSLAQRKRLMEQK